MQLTNFSYLLVSTLSLPINYISRICFPSNDTALFYNLQLVNHNIACEVIERMKADITEFFNLPLETKKAFSQLPGNLEGYGQLFVISEDQKLDWADMLYLNTQPLNIRSINLWPSQPLTFR